MFEGGWIWQWRMDMAIMTIMLVVMARSRPSNQSKQGWLCSPN